MTYEEARENLRMGCCHVGYQHKKCTECEYAFAFEALKKQIPQKPRIEYWENRVQSEQKVFVCPTCKEIEFGFNQPKFCQNCGQAIDWGDEE